MEDVDVSKFTGSCNCKKWEVCNVTSGQCDTDLRLCQVADDTCLKKVYRLGICPIYSTLNYKGNVSTTRKGYTCQRWDRQYPHGHMTELTNLPDDSWSEAGNYCRDVGNVGYTWCYTTNPDVKKDVCLVTKCLTDYNPEDCYRFDQAASAYLGHRNVTINGRQCQFWNSQTPHLHWYVADHFYPENNIIAARNYCRDVDVSGFAWCYTTDVLVRWEKCDVSVCHD